MKSNRFVTFFAALAFLLVSVLPGFVSPAYAADPETWNFAGGSYIYGITGMTLPSGATGPFVRYDSGSYYESESFFYDSRYYRFTEGESSYEEILEAREMISIFGAADKEVFVFSSFVKGPGIYKPCSGLFEIPYLYDEEYGCYWNFSDIGFSIDYYHNFPNTSLSTTVYFKFYDSDLNEVGHHAGIIPSMLGESYNTYSKTYAIPAGAVYFDVYMLTGFRNLLEGRLYKFNLSDLNVWFYASDSSYDGPLIPEPSTPGSGSGGSGSNTGGSSGGSSSGGVTDSDLEDMKDSFSSAIDTQTGQIGEMIDGVRDDLNDIEENLDDVNSNLQDANDKLDDANSTLSDTLDEVKSLPEKIMDGISGLFVPDEEDMAEYNDRWNELLRSRFGALYESADIISSVGSAFTASVADPTDTIDFPAVTLDLAGAEFVFGGWEVDVIPEGFEGIVELLKTMISLLATVSFVNALRNKLDRLMEGA